MGIKQHVSETRTSHNDAAEYLNILGRHDASTGNYQPTRRNMPKNKISKILKSSKFAHLHEREA